MSPAEKSGAVHSRERTKQRVSAPAALVRSETDGSSAHADQRETGMGFGKVFNGFAAIALAVSSFGAAAKSADEVPEAVQKVLASIQTLSSPAPAPEDFGF